MIDASSFRKNMTAIVNGLGDEVQTVRVTKNKKTFFIAVTQEWFERASRALVEMQATQEQAKPVIKEEEVNDDLSELIID